MNRKNIFTLFIVASLLLLAAALRAPMPSAQAQAGPDATQANVGTAFTYQGRLTNASGPVDGACDFRFELWTAASGGQQAGATIEKPNISLTNGNFTVTLDFGGEFNGGARFLQIAVRCPAGSGSYTPLSGRVALTATPYAISLAPGAFVQDASQSPTTAFWATSGQSWTMPLLIALKVAGVWGDSQYNDGVIGTSQQGNGVYGYSETGKAVYADGDAHVEGKLTWKTMHSAIAIATSAFIPELIGTPGHVEYDNEGYRLKNQNSSGRWYTAAVQLPHKASVTRLTVCWKDGSDESARLYLKRRSLVDVTAPTETMAYVDSVGSYHSIRQGCWDEDSIISNTVDNIANTYFLEVELPANGEDIELLGVSIEYDIVQPY